MLSSRSTVHQKNVHFFKEQIELQFDIAGSASYWQLNIRSDNDRQEENGGNSHQLHPGT